MMPGILHISDLHFGPHYQPHVGQALLEIAPRLKPDVVVASGDFTQRAKPRQFAAARDYLAQLPRVPVVVVPGNHDIPLYRVHERLFSPYKLYRQHISADLDTVLTTHELAIAALNTTSPWRHVTEGRLHAWQIDLCAEFFQSAPAGLVKVVVVHHHFAPAPDYDSNDHAMAKARQALDRFDELGVELILGGHLHRAYIGNSLDVYPPRARSEGIVIAQAGTCVSRRGRAREREKNSFNWIEIRPDVLEVLHYMYFQDAGGFRPVGRHVFPRRSKRYLE